MMSVVQAVECYVAHFHAINYEYSNRPLPQISQYYVIYFSLITLQRIYPGIDSYSCQIQVECSSCFHSNTHTIRLKYFVQFSTDKCAKNGALEHYRPERNTAYHQVFKHNRHKFSSKMSINSENQYSHQLVLKYQRHS